MSAYLGSDAALGEIAGRLPSRNAAVELIAVLHDVHYGRRPVDEGWAAIRAFQNFPVDPELHVLVLAAIEVFCANRLRLQDAELALERARLLVKAADPPEFHSLLLTLEANLCSFKGNEARAEELLRQALARLPKTALRRPKLAQALALLLAVQGRGHDADGLLDAAGAGAGHAEWRCYFQFACAVHSGRANDALTQLAPLDQAQAIHAGYPHDLRTTLHLLRLQVPALALPPRLSRLLEGAAEPAWTRSARELLAGRVPDALASARDSIVKEPLCAVGSTFSAFTLIRAELAAGNAHAAKRLIDAREEKGRRHFLHAFFMARAANLDGDADSAAGWLSSLLAMVERHQAEGRLEFELRLAPDFSAAVAMRLARRTQKIPRHERQARVLPGVAREPGGLERILGADPAIRNVRRQLDKFARLDVPVLITGETGTGKDLAARALHECGPRKNRPFVAINCATISESLLESQLFGHTRGAFTGAVRNHKGVFESAGEGTLFLDEIGEVPPRLQAALLRVLESGEFQPVGSERIDKARCRLVFATNTDLQAVADAGAFRKDLVFRLMRLSVHLPALRHRRDDVPLLARSFLTAGRASNSVVTIDPALERALLAYDWPGNVRELRNEIERMRCLTSDKLYYEFADLSPEIAGRRTALPAGASGQHRLPPGLSAETAAAPANTLTQVVGNGRGQMRRLERLRRLFAQQPTLTRGEVIQLLQVAPATAAADLKALCNEGFIKKVCPSASSRSNYFERVEIETRW